MERVVSSDTGIRKPHQSSNPIIPILMPGFFAQRYTPPFRHELPGTMKEMLENESSGRKVSANFKLLRRWLWLKMNLPSRLLWDRLPPAPARLLWLNYSSTSIGDSIMELAGRSMLGAYHVDLLTDPRHAELYLHDRFFQSVFTQADQLDSSRYDFVLLDLFNTRSIRLKTSIGPKLPCACLQSFFYGAHFNRTLFSCYRIHHLLGYPYDDAKLQPFLRPTLFADGEPAVLPPKRKQKRIALMLGGVEPFKTYRQWPEAIRLLRAQWPSGREFPEFVLIGSENGAPYVDQVLAALKDCDAVPRVGGLTLRQTVRALADCDAFIGTDGGLMHCAVALNVPGVALFARFHPRILLPPQTTMDSIYDAQDVNNITPAAVTDAILVHLTRV
ncbi:MAG TPA: glycosyltransferase family 9 protein [Verrucomicrobiae bacterium]|jgi:heptosyltransferase-2|nr:glycosyltransferase family 9 protein [Verrucomicrobiae bacterium]